MSKKKKIFNYQIIFLDDTTQIVDYHFLLVQIIGLSFPVFDKNFKVYRYILACPTIRELCNVLYRVITEFHRIQLYLVVLH